MRIRTIKPEFFKHDGLASIDPVGRILFQGLWCLADKEGRLEDRPNRIKVEVLPYDNADVDSYLGMLERGGFIKRYESDGIKVIQITSFKRHQRITGKEADSTSRFPECENPKESKQRGNNGETPETTGNGRETEGKGRETIGAISQLKSKLEKMFKRPHSLSWPHSEEFALAEVCRRPSVMDEISELEKFKAKPDSFFPKSVSSLLNGWQATIDRSRNHSEAEPQRSGGFD